jgi:hypothetical protein
MVECHKEVTKQCKSRFFFLFLAGSGAGSVLVTNGSGYESGRPKNLTDPDSTTLVKTTGYIPSAWSEDVVCEKRIGKAAKLYKN